MGVRRGVGGAGMAMRPWWAILTALAMGLALLAALGGDARARPVPRPLDYHAMVLNGRVVGSAFMIAEAVGVTNAHVLRGRRVGDKITLVPSDPSRDPVLARIRAISARMDVAVLDLPPDLLPLVPAVGSVAAGERVVSAGIDAGGPAWPGAPREAAGVVLDPRASIEVFGPGLILRMPEARPGFSGGPLLDAQGRLIGMVTAIRDGEAASAREAYALRVAEVRAEVGRLLAGR